MYRQILDAIEANNYNNFTRRAYVPKWKKLLLLPVALAYAQVPGMAPTGAPIGAGPAGSRLLAE